MGLLSHTLYTTIMFKHYKLGGMHDVTGPSVGHEIATFINNVLDFLLRVLVDEILTHWYGMLVKMVLKPKVVMTFPWLLRGKLLCHGLHV